MAEATFNTLEDIKYEIKFLYEIGVKIEDIDYLIELKTKIN